MFESLGTIEGTFHRWMISNLSFDIFPLEMMLYAIALKAILLPGSSSLFAMAKRAPAGLATCPCSLGEFRSVYRIALAAVFADSQMSFGTIELVEMTRNKSCTTFCAASIFELGIHHFSVGPCTLWITGHLIAVESSTLNFKELTTGWILTLAKVSLGAE